LHWQLGLVVALVLHFTEKGLRLRSPSRRRENACERNRDVTRRRPPRAPKVPEQSGLVFAKRRAVVIELVSLRRKQFERQMARQ
jgi:hypothetical protein